MKPHEIIEVIFTKVCSSYRTTPKQILARNEHGFANHSTKYSRSRVICGALVAKYLGVEFAADVMRTDIDTISVYQAHHKVYCGKSEVVLGVTLDVINEITADDYNPAGQHNHYPIYRKEPTDVHALMQRLSA